MAYTASALSYMLENLNKTVIITGSQIPMSELRNDAEENLLAAILIAGQYSVPEVCLFFNNKLMRGNRTTKRASDKIEAFDSPNMPPLAIFEVSIKINFDLVQRFSLEGKLSV